ncbi:MAG: winged helix-turn-helix domain-containing protein [Acidobacteria bacterium]|nr:winged helix-turn-helix domain-containing protein [Acidobacteriota bacterium]
MKTPACLFYQFGPFRLEAQKRTLLREGELVPLAPKAFDVLLVLVERQGEVLDKDRLMEMLWPDSEVEESNLPQHISALRKALGESPNERKYITTVPGRGYKFAAEVRVVSSDDSEVVVERYAKATLVVEEKEQEQVEEFGKADLAQLPASVSRSLSGNSRQLLGLVVLLLAALGFSYWLYNRGAARPIQIESIAILPFVNESGNADLEYLSDGMTDTLISNLSQLPKLNVKSRSSVFRYKGKEIVPQRVGKELSVQAILTGRVVQRGNDLTLHIELVDAQTENALWSTDYKRSMTNLISLQSEIVRDLSQKLRARLSSADEQKVAKNYTANAEAYQLYLRGRYHVLKIIRLETQKGISYFQQAIAIDPNYALAYVGLADGYRVLSLGGEMPSREFMPKAKAAAQKAIELDDTLAEAHAVLGNIIFWYDWDWNESEKQLKRALELDLNNADTHLHYAGLLSHTGRHAEALAEAKRARELEPLNLRTNAVEGLFLINAGRPDEALARLQETLELDANYWLPHAFAASAYIEKGMYAEAITEARKAQELSGASTSQPIFLLGYALAKSGKQAEARGLLKDLLKLSTEPYASAYSIAMIYNGLGERDQTLAWLERGFEERNVRMTFLKVEPKWNNLRADPRFQDLLRRIGFLP